MDHLLELGAGVDEGLGRDAAPVQAGAAQAVLVHDDGVQAQLARTNGGGIAARAAADDENLTRFRLGHEQNSCGSGIDWRDV